MTLYARVVDGRVTGDPVDLPAPPQACFVPEEAELYHPATPEVRHGWSHDGNGFAAPVASLEEVQSLARHRAIDHHAAVIRAGFPFQGKRFQADPPALAAIAAAAAAPAGDLDWIALDNSIVTIKEADIPAFVQAAAGFAGAARLTLRKAKDEIAAAATADKAAAIDVAAGYPQ